jgi:hypothetical protein
MTYEALLVICFMLCGWVFLLERAVSRLNEEVDTLCEALVKVAHDEWTITPNDRGGVDITVVGDVEDERGT